MAKALKIVAAIAVVGALAIVTGGAAVGIGLSLSTSFLGVSASALLAAGAVLSAGASLLSPRPKVPSTSSSTADRLQVSIDLRAPRKMIFGRTAMATDLRDQEYAGDQSYIDRFIVAASHRVKSIQEIWFDDKPAWTSTGGVSGEFLGYLTVEPIIEGSAANAIYTSGRMGISRRFTGCAYVHLRYKLTGNSKKTDSPFASSIPTRVTIIGEGASVYDPRLDSTVSGGSGSQRANDQSTWTSNSAAMRNTALCLLWYMLGWKINGKLAVGKGIPQARIDLASFITAANICDEPVATPGGGTEPRYCCDGIFSEGDDTSLVFDNFKAAMNAVLDDVDGKLRVTVLHNDLAAPIGSLVTADVLGEFNWDQTGALNDSINVIRGGYTDPSASSLYQLVDAPDVRVESPDGIDRSQTLNMPIVQSASQWQRLARQRLQRSLYAGTFTAVFQATAWKFQKGDVITLSFYPLGFDAKLFRIVDMTVQLDGTVPMMLREEHPDIYAAYNNATAAIVAAAPTTYNPRLLPVIQGIVDAQTSIDLLASDGVLSHGSEKSNLIVEYTALYNEFAALDNRYQALGAPAGSTAARDTAFAKRQALDALLMSYAPAWNDIATDTIINGAQFRNVWADASLAISVFGAALTGGTGAPGAPGANGLPSYFHTAFANSPTGSIDFTTGLPDGRAFIGTYSDTVAADSNDPNVYAWTAYKGPANFGLVAGGVAIVASNTLVLTQTTSGWGFAGGYSTEGWRGGAQASFKLDPGTFGGLNADPAADQSFVTIDYAFHCSGDGFTYIYESGAVIQNIGANDPDRRFQVIYDNAFVRYYVGGSMVREVAAAANQTLYFDAAFWAGAGAKIREIAFSAAAKAGDVGQPGVSPITVSAQPESIQINLDGSGVPQNLPQAIGNIAFRAGAPVAITSVSIVSSSGVTASVSGASINITGTSGGVDGEVVYDVVAAGQTVRKRVAVSITRSGTDGAVATTLSITTPQISWASYQQHGGTLAMNASATGKIDINLGGAMRPALGGTLQFYSKLQYRITGGTWTDVPGSERLSTLSEQSFDPPRQSNANVNSAGPYSLTGLTSSGAYEFRALDYKVGTSDNSTFVSLGINGKQVA